MVEYTFGYIVVVVSMQAHNTFYCTNSNIIFDSRVAIKKNTSELTWKSLIQIVLCKTTKDIDVAGANIYLEFLIVSFSFSIYL